MIKDNGNGTFSLVHDYLPFKSKPLTDQEIAELEQQWIEVELFDEGEYGTQYNVYGVKDLIKEVERIHGIK